MSNFLFRLLFAGTLLCLAFLFTACGTFMQNMERGYTGTKETRQLITSVMDPRCMAISKACPKTKPTDTLETCKDYISCRDARRALYKVTSSIQIGIKVAATQYAMGQEGSAKGLAIRIGLQLLELESLLRKHKIVNLPSLVKP